MLAVRVIPTLLLRNSGLVKGSQFKDHKYVGDPINAVKIFNDKEVDEMLFLDIAATSSGAGPNFELLADITRQAFMPFGYGGGICNTKQIEQLFRLGIEKVVLNTAALESPTLIAEASSIAGAQSIVISIDVKKSLLGSYTVYSHSGTRNTKQKPVDWARRAEELGAGELIITSIDREGTGRGFDAALIESVSAAVSIPVIAAGGAGTMSDLKQGVTSGASALGVGDMVTFHGKHKAVLITYPKYSELEALFDS